MVFVLLVLFKIINRRYWVKADDWTQLSRTLKTLRWYKNDEIDPDYELAEATKTLSPPMAASTAELPGP